MALLRNFLDRFRPAGAPGAASRVGVPKDRSAELAAELAPVLAGLAQTGAECEEAIARANARAGQIAADARNEKSAIEATARRDSLAARERAARRIVEHARDEARAEVRAAAEQAGRLRQPPESAVAELAGEAVRVVRAIPGGLGSASL